MKVITLVNLPDNFRIGLDGKFRIKLFNDCIRKLGNSKVLAKELGYARKTIEGLRRGYNSDGRNKKVKRYIKVKTLRKLAKIVNVNLEKIEQYICEINSIGINLKIKLPIYASPELANTIGHTFGDGHISNQSFQYYNKSMSLIKEVQINIKNIFGIDGKIIFHHGTYMLYFPGIIGKMLLLSGSILGNKNQKFIEIPIWVKNGSKKTKSSFLRALFDDEGSVKFKGYDRSIQFRLFKKKELYRLHKKFFEDLCMLLLDIGIEPTKLRRIKTKDDSSIGIGFLISNNQNLKIFLKKINFTHPRKKQILEKAVKTYKQIQHHHRENYSESLKYSEVRINNKWIMPGVRER